jgi:AcrR family transcriptional regulator
MLSQRGLDVSLDEIAAHAGVGPGTLHRHFPTKDALMDATIAEGLTELSREAGGLARAEDPVAAFYRFFVHAVERGSSIHALARRIWGSAVNVDGAIAAPLRDVRAGIATLFRRAQQARGVRMDLEPPDLDALLAAAHVVNVHPNGGRRLVEVLCDAMRAPGPPGDDQPTGASSRRAGLPPSRRIRAPRLRGS